MEFSLFSHYERKKKKCRQPPLNLIALSLPIPGLMGKGTEWHSGRAWISDWEPGLQIADHAAWQRGARARSVTPPQPAAGDRLWLPCVPHLSFFVRSLRVVDEANHPLTTSYFSRVSHATGPGVQRPQVAIVCLSICLSPSPHCLLGILPFGKLNVASRWKQHRKGIAFIFKIGNAEKERVQDNPCGLKKRRKSPLV